MQNMQRMHDRLFPPPFTPFAPLAVPTSAAAPAATADPPQPTTWPSPPPARTARLLLRCASGQIYSKILARISDYSYCASASASHARSRGERRERGRLKELGGPEYLIAPQNSLPIGFEDKAGRAHPLVAPPVLAVAIL